ncbi:type II toxin-antitoxin system ParD family antitoxin [Paraburkholderia sp. J94]|uniref:type II toxin-antitoxin system ParD family antitoxin n=1 Tax=Paraburkholderia sp. J94 TaxID=2805441 RepID=UPI002AB251D8|nr:type II toxin-antitoxin system ParD family antitoxin [Paraburkholderia sp. J94]
MHHGIICQSQSVIEGAAMPTRNVVLTDHQAKLIDTLVNSGRFQNASEVLRAGLRLIERDEAESQARIEALRDAVRTGQADADAGRVHVFAAGQGLAEHLDSLADSAVATARATKRAQ